MLCNKNEKNQVRMRASVSSSMRNKTNNGLWMFIVSLKKMLIQHVGFVPDCLDDDLDNVAGKAVICTSDAEAGMGSHAEGCDA